MCMSGIFFIPYVRICLDILSDMYSREYTYVYYMDVYALIDLTHIISFCYNNKI